LADLRTATPIYLAALKVVPTIQQLANLIPSGRFVPAVTLEALRDAKLYQSEIVQSRMLIGSGMSAMGHGQLCCQLMRLDAIAVNVIQAPKPEPRIMRYELSD
jgi:hypothetical protein